MKRLLMCACTCFALAALVGCPGPDYFPPRTGPTQPSPSPGPTEEALNLVDTRLNKTPTPGPAPAPAPTPAPTSEIPSVPPVPAADPTVLPMPAPAPAPITPSARKTVHVPNVIGLTPAQAQGRLRAAGLHAQLLTRVSNGKVKQQFPAAGQRVPIHSSVRLTLTAATVRVPSLVGLTAAQAHQRLQAAGLQIHYATALHQGGQVHSQSVPAGTQVQPHTAITVTFQPPIRR